MEQVSAGGRFDAVFYFGDFRDGQLYTDKHGQGRLTEVFESPPSCFVGPNGNQAFFEGAFSPGDGSGELYAEAARLLSPEPVVTGVVPPGFKPVEENVGNEMVRFGAPGR